MDLNALEYAIHVDGNIDSLAVSYMDELDQLKEWKICTDYFNNKLGKIWQLKNMADTQSKITQRLLNSHPMYVEEPGTEIPKILENILKKKIKILSYGPKSNEKVLTNS